VSAKDLSIPGLRLAGCQEQDILGLNVPDDAERVLGLRPVAMIREDRAVRRAQDRGQVVAGRSTPAARRVAALARRILDEGRSA
jgi:septum formation inhibitor-activating ATPase MinD